MFRFVGRKSIESNRLACSFCSMMFFVLFGRGFESEINWKSVWRFMLGYENSPWVLTIAKLCYWVKTMLYNAKLCCKLGFRFHCDTQLTRSKYAFEFLGLMKRFICCVLCEGMKQIDTIQIVLFEMRRWFGLTFWAISVRLGKFLNFNPLNLSMMIFVSMREKCFVNIISSCVQIWDDGGFLIVCFWEGRNLNGQENLWELFNTLIESG